MKFLKNPSVASTLALNKTHPLPPLNKTHPHTYTNLKPLTAHLLIHVTPLNKLPPTHTQLYPHWQLNSYLILPPLKKLTARSYIIIPPLAAQLLHHFPPLNKLPPHSYIILPFFLPLQPIATHS